MCSEDPAIWEKLANAIRYTAPPKPRTEKRQDRQGEPADKQNVQALTLATKPQEGSSQPGLPTGAGGPCAEQDAAAPGKEKMRAKLRKIWHKLGSILFDSECAVTKKRGAMLLISPFPPAFDQPPFFYPPSQKFCGRVIRWTSAGAGPRSTV